MEGGPAQRRGRDGDRGRGRGKRRKRQRQRQRRRQRQREAETETEAEAETAPGRPQQSGFRRTLVPPRKAHVLVRGLCGSAEAFLGNCLQRRVLQGPRVGRRLRCPRPAPAVAAAPTPAAPASVPATSPAVGARAAAPSARPPRYPKAPPTPSAATATSPAPRSAARQEDSLLESQMQLGSLQYPHNPMKGASEHFHFLSTRCATSTSAAWATCATASLPAFPPSACPAAADGGAVREGQPIARAALQRSCRAATEELAERLSIPD